MTDTPTPAQQLEEVLSLHTHMVEVRRSGEEATAIHYQREFLCYAAEYVASHADTLRRALAALEAVEGAIKADTIAYSRPPMRAVTGIAVDDDRLTPLIGTRVLIIPAAPRNL